MRIQIARPAALIVPLLAACLSVYAADEPKKPAAVAKPAAKPAAPAAKPGAAPGAAKPAGATAAAPHGPTTASPAAAHGPTTASPAARPATANPGAASRPGAPAGRPEAGGRAPGANNRPLPAGHREVEVRGGGNARLDSRGHVSEVHARGMDIHRGPDGSRRIMAERADHSRVFAERGGRGYVQRPYMYGGREFAHRTYYVNGRAYDRFYNRYEYHGVFLEGYAPRAYFAPAFYGWAYNPWVTPVPYAWGWVGNPWAVYYGGYFTPYPVYPSASLWLTDYMISTSLAAAYQAQVEAAAGAAMAPPPPPAILTPEVKQLIAAEVQRQLALENAEQGQIAQNQQPDPASSGIVRMLSDNNTHVFVAGGSLSVMDNSGQECSLSQGDVVQLVAPPPAGTTAASAVVLAGKGQDCRKGGTVSIELTDLQDMQNHMRETIDQGMGDIQSHPGQGGLPALPVAARAAPVTAPFAAIAPPPDPNAAAEINQQVQAADSLEKDVVAGGPSDNNSTATMAAPPPPAAPAGPPPTLKLGLTFDEVVAAVGQPKNIIDLGNKKTYVYPDMKVFFVGGKVTDIQ
jgi:hypothetical protein